MTARTSTRQIYYGWRIAGSLAVTETVSWGILYYAFSVFLVPMQVELGWSLTVLTGAYSLALLCSGLVAPLVGRWIDRHGPRLLMTAGSILGVAGVLSWSRVDSVGMYYLTWAAIGIAMAATLYDPAFTTLIRWFERDRGRAILLVTIAAGFASTIFLPLSSILVERFEWRPALVVLAGILAISTIPLHALVLRSRPEDLGTRVDGASAADLDASTRRPLAGGGASLHAAVRQASFWLLTASFVLQQFAMVSIALILIPYLTDRGDSPAFAATATGLIGAAQVVARIVSTALGDRVSAVATTASIFALQAAGVAVLVGWETRAGIIAAVLLFGTSRGVVTLMRPQLVGDFYGRTHFGAINGTLAMALQGASALAPISAGLIVSFFDSYTPLLWGMGGLSLGAAAVMLGLGRQRHREVASLAS
jgi:MFS family permease